MNGKEIHTLKESQKLNREARPIDYFIDSITGCWNVVSHVSNSGGYIHVRRNGQRIQVHRYSYELVSGPIPKGLFVCHHCDNPRCINPVHLFLGTQKDNLQDMTKKKRRTHKLIETDVVAIQTDRTSTQTELGEKYGVSQVQVSRIKRGETWRHLFLPNEVCT